MSFKNANVLMPAVVFAVGLALILFGERQTVNDGLGWDGTLYANWVRDTYNVLFVQGLEAYFTRRVLPSLVVRGGMELLSAPFTNRNIVLAYEVYNLVLLTASAHVWGRVADELKLEDRAKWFGFLFLFVNFTNLKWNFYAPVWTDPPAFTLGLLAFYFYLKDRPGWLALVVFLSGFTWPTGPLMFSLLLVFPRREGEPAPVPYRLNLVAAGAAALVTAAAVLRLTDARLPERVQWFYRLLWVDTDFARLSAAALVAYVFFAYRGVLADGRLFDPRHALRSVRWRRVPLVAAILAAQKLIQLAIWNGQDIHVGSTKMFVMQTLLSGMTEPLIPVVAHPLWYGPWFLLLLLFWKPFCRACAGYGLGMSALLLVTVFVSICSQSRWTANVFPVFVAVLVRALWPVLKGQSLLLWAALCLVYSKVWLVMNTAPFVDDGTMEGLLSFPLQRQFMTFGTYMARETYFAQGAAVLLTGALLYFVVRRGRAAGVAREAPAPARLAPENAGNF
ncbi:MAG TPA: hypothetical protein VF659_05070 [Pyrinomonadaceae bacterium]